MPNIYFIIAYRWDCINLHQYVVGARVDKDLAISVAHSEHIDRGGKYGVGVYLCENDRDLEHELVHYISSSRGRKQPRMCWREWLSDQIGARVLMMEDSELPESLVAFRNNMQKVADDAEKVL